MNLGDFKDGDTVFLDLTEAKWCRECGFGHEGVGSINELEKGTVGSFSP